MTTLVTGAGGFLGGHVVRTLLEQGESVRALDLAYPAGFPEQVERIEGSILDPDTMARAVSGADHVIHAAAIAHLWAPGRFTYDRVNGLGTCRVLAAARRTGAKVVHVSSYTTLIARGTPAEALLDETVEIPPSQLLGAYPRTKRQAELFALSAVANGQPVTMVLPAAPIGAGDVNLTPPTAMIRDLAAGKTPALLDCLLNLVDARAVARAIVAARTQGENGQRYLLTGEHISLRHLAEKIAARTGVAAPRATVPLFVALAAARAEAVLSRMTGRAPKAPLTGVRLAAHPVRFDNARARRVLGFQPRPLDTCLDEALDWLRTNAHLPDQG